MGLRRFPISEKSTSAYGGTARSTKSELTSEKEGLKKSILTVLELVLNESSFSQKTETTLRYVIHIIELLLSKEDSDFGDDILYANKEIDQESYQGR